MPYADPERARAYFRNYRRTRRSGDTCSTPVHPAVSVEFRLETAGDVIALAISPFGLWQNLPGFERLQRALKTVEGTPDMPGPAFTPKGMARWLNHILPAGNPEVTEADLITAEWIADPADAAFRERVRW